MSGRLFVLLGVRSLGGTWPVAVDPADLGGAEPTLPGIGSIVSATCWIAGHLADQPHASPVAAPAAAADA
jgi:hypothetical protein